MSDTAPPGWYIIPGTNTYRWWDGTAWTDIPAPPAPPQAVQTDRQRRAVRNAWITIGSIPAVFVALLVLGALSPAWAWLAVLYLLVAIVVGLPVNIVRIVKNSPRTPKGTP